MREQYVFVHGIGWQAIAEAAAVMAQEVGPSWLSKLEATLHSINWTKANQDWQHLCMIGDRMNNTRPGIKSTAGYILVKAGVTDGEKAKPFVDQYLRDSGQAADVKAR